MTEIIQVPAIATTNLNDTHGAGSYPENLQMVAR